MNLALARNCNAPVNNEVGARASESDWQEGKPVRVVRNFKLQKCSNYAPKNGNRYVELIVCTFVSNRQNDPSLTILGLGHRYDGIYKVIRYYPDRSTHGFLVWKYVLRRDDPIPAPWTEE